MRLSMKTSENIKRADQATDTQASSIDDENRSGEKPITILYYYLTQTHTFIMNMIHAHDKPSSIENQIA